MLQTEIKAKELDDDEAERQEGIHLIYVTKCDDAIAAAQSYLTSREGEATSVLNLRHKPNDPPEPNPFLPLIPLSTETKVMSRSKRFLGQSLSQVSVDGS